MARDKAGPRFRPEEPGPGTGESLKGLKKWDAMLCVELEKDCSDYRAKGGCRGQGAEAAGPRPVRRLMPFKSGIFMGTQHSLKSAHLTHTYVHAHSFSCSQLFVTPWIIARQASLSMEFSRQEYWSGLPCPPPADLSHPRTEFTSPALAGGFFTTEPPGAHNQRMWCMYYCYHH